MAKAILVTGASVGLGRELVRLAAREGRELVLTARDAVRLAEVAAEARQLGARQVDVLPGDLADPSTPAQLCRELAARGIAVDTLINNAGFGTHGRFAESDLAAQRAMLEVDVAALVELTHRLLPPMLAARSGRILNVASTAAFQPGPYMAVYYASKAFVLSFSEALAYELSGSGVSVTCLCPGPTRTEFQARSGMEKLRMLHNPLIRVASAEAVAKAGYRGLLAGKRLVIPGFPNWLGTFVLRFVPRRAVPAVVAWLQRA